eukprot:1851398-Rhodomonas_salina.1
MAIHCCSVACSPSVDTLRIACARARVNRAWRAAEHRDRRRAACAARCASCGMCGTAGEREGSASCGVCGRGERDHEMAEHRDQPSVARVVEQREGCSERGAWPRTERPTCRRTSADACEG